MPDPSRRFGGLSVAEPARILIVEDDLSIAGLLTEALSDEGYTVRHYTDGAAAIEHLDEFRPHLILLDLMLPGMDGWAFRAAQRQLPGDAASIPVVVVTAARDATERTASMAVTAVVTKPFDLDRMMDLVADVVAGAPA